MSARKHFYVGVKGVVVNPLFKKALVLSKQDQNGKKFWDIPGGRIDDDERIEETLKRELQEEIPNIRNFEVKGLLHAYRLSRDLNDGLGLMLLFHKIEADIEKIELSKEHDEYKWVGLEDLKNLNTDGTYIEEGYLEALRLALS